MTARGIRLARKFARGVRSLRASCANDSWDNSDEALVFHVERRLRFRELLAVANIFALGGYRVRFLVSGPDAIRKLLWYDLTSFCKIPGLAFITRLPSKVSAVSIATDSETASLVGRDWKRVYRVNFDIPSFRTNSGVLFPYPMHPNIYLQYGDHERLEQYRGHKKSIRVLFAGNVGGGYGRGKLFDSISMLSRGEVVDHIVSRQLARVVRSASELADITETAGRSEFVLVDGAHCKIDQRLWLDTVARCDFLLCLPGVVMPMCHAPVEAMAVGTVPLLNYPDWFIPPLEPARQCLAFSTFEDLESGLYRALQMDEQQMGAMRQAALGYYAENLDPAHVFARLRSLPAREIVLNHYSDAYTDR